MRHFSIVRLIFFLTFLDPGLQGVSQDLIGTIEFAESQLSRGDIEGGISFYKRAVFFAPDSMLGSLYERLGDAYENKGDFEQARHYFDRAYLSLPPGSQSMECAFKSIRCDIQDHNWLQGLSSALQLPDNLTYDQERRQQFYFGVIYFGLDSFELSRQYFIESLDSISLADSVRLNFIFGDKKQFYRPNPKTAQTLSIIIPGAGQLYSGDYGNAANSFILTSGLVAIAVYVTVNYGAWNSLLTVMPWFQRYYTGGFKNAASIAQARLEAKRGAAYAEVIAVLSGSDKSIAPPD